MTKNNAAEISLRSLSLLAGLLVAVLIILFAGFLRYSWVAERESATREISSPLRFAATYCEGYFGRVEKQHRILALELLEQKGQVSAGKAMKMLNNYKGINHDQRWFSLLSASGELIAETDTALNEHRPYYLSEIPVRQLPIEALPEERLELEQIQEGVSEESLTLPFRFAIRDTQGELKYLVRSRLRLGLLQDFWKTALIPQESTFGFLHHQGYLVSSYSANPGAKTEKDFGNASTLALAKHLQSTGFPTGGFLQVHHNVEGPGHLVVFQKLTYHPITVFSSIPMSYVWAGWWGRVRIPTILVLALLVVGIATYWLVVTQHQEKRRFIRKQLQLQDVAQGILVTQEQERARISHELHDEIGQSLTALKITINRAQQNVVDRGRVESLLSTGQQMVESLMNDVREIAYRLRPSELDQLGLAAALRAHLEKAVRPLVQNVTFLENLGDRRFSADLELCCFRVAQEALTNCLRHAKATGLEVSLNYEPPYLTLSVVDNGVGFDAASYYSAPDHSRSLGLVGMRERVMANGGRFGIRRLPESGTEVTATFDRAGDFW